MVKVVAVMRGVMRRFRRPVWRPAATPASSFGRVRRVLVAVLHEVLVVVEGELAVVVHVVQLEDRVDLGGKVAGVIPNR